MLFCYLSPATLTKFIQTHFKRNLNLYTSVLPRYLSIKFSDHKIKIFKLLINIGLYYVLVTTTLALVKARHKRKFNLFIRIPLSIVCTFARIN